MPARSKDRLIEAAIAARENAVATYSKFKVGAALLTRSGEIVTGANIENVSFGLTCCAERVAVFKAVSDGYRDFLAIGVVARIEGGPMPCGACRQVLYEFAPSASVYVADVEDPSKIAEHKLAELLPHAFDDLDQS